jgi:hypothetical protein
MAVYRFRVCLEENEDISRDIDIKSSQTFEQFHLAIQEAFKFDNKHAASFFVSDDYWRKNQEITFRKEDLPLDDEEIRKKVDQKKLMSETKIARYIEQPHQRFVYIFDALAQWGFLVEMIKIVDDNPKINYPICIKSVGTAPKQYKQIIIPKDDLNSDLTATTLLNDPEIDEEEIIKEIENTQEGIEEDDINSLEGEEGEETEDDELNTETEDNPFEPFNEDEH